MKIVFASNNQYKFKEVKALLASSIELLSLSDIGCNDEIPETQTTIKGNASQKSHFIYEVGLIHFFDYKPKNCITDCAKTNFNISGS